MEEKIKRKDKRSREEPITRMRTSKRETTSKSLEVVRKTVLDSIDIFLRTKYRPLGWAPQSVYQDDRNLSYITSPLRPFMSEILVPCKCAAIFMIKSMMLIHSRSRPRSKPQVYYFEIPNIPDSKPGTVRVPNRFAENNIMLKNKLNFKLYHSGSIPTITELS